jgi:DNA-binding transcriptional LysR family regulator
LEGNAANIRNRARDSLAPCLVAYDSIMEPDRWPALDLRHLVALKTIADEGSFGRAADRLGYTQSAVSQQIATLERVVGLRLIERPGGPRPISLTEAGQILLRHAEAIDARLRAAKADMEALSAGEAGRLRIGTFQSVGARVLPTLLRRFAEAHPQVEISLQESSNEDELLELVERGELDVTFNTLPLPSGPFEVVELLRDPYVLVVPAGSPLAASARPPSLREITLQPLISFSRCRAIDVVETQLGSSGRTPNVVFRSDNNGTVQGLVGAGVGISVAPLLTVDADDKSVVVIDLGGRIAPRVIGFAWHRDRHRSPAAVAFVETAISVCGALSIEPAAA